MPAGDGKPVLESDHQQFIDSGTALVQKSTCWYRGGYDHAESCTATH